MTQIIFFFKHIFGDTENVLLLIKNDTRLMYHVNILVALLPPGRELVMAFLLLLITITTIFQKYKYMMPTIFSRHLVVSVESSYSRS